MTNVNFSRQHPTLVRLMSAHSLFHGLPAAIITTLADTATAQQADAGDLLFREGDPALHWLLVEHGRVELLRYSADGVERVFRTFGSGQLVAEFAMFMPHGRYPMNARADTDVSVFCLPRAALRQSCIEYGSLALRVLENLSQRLYRSVNEVEWLTASSGAQRLAAYLMDLHDCQSSVVVALPLSQRQLAARLGIRAETLSRLLSEWSRHAYISGKQRNWTLRNLDYLRDMASGSVRSF
jgi:CRP-like cAMP-binding protein